MTSNFMVGPVEFKFALYLDLDRFLVILKKDV